MFRIKKSHTAAVALVAALLAVFASPMFVHAVTIISGTTSGTWTPAGNPYIIGTYTEVTTGNSLTIEPGVEVVIGPDVQFRINGTITAVGTFNDPILFMGTSPSNYWERIYIYQDHGSKIEYCKFTDAKTALYLYVYNQTMNTEISSCSFDNMIDYGVVTYSKEYNYSHAYLNSTIKNCSFNGMRYGCLVYEVGTWSYANTSHIGNIFSNISVSAISFERGVDGGSCSPKVINNVFLDSARGVDIKSSTFDVDVINNIFFGSSSAVSRSVSGSLDVEYNCFYNNIANFTGYPSTYGQVIWSNDNGNPCDLFYNIFMDPQFEPGSFALNAASPCIDAGDPSIVDYYAPILGSTLSDMGAYGGAEPGAGVPPQPPVIIAQPQSTTVFLGQDVTFEVEAVGFELHYQWYFGASKLNGETSDTLNLTSVDFADAGNYYCAVSNVYDVVTSAAANLRVTEIGLDIAMHAGLHMTNLNVGTTYSIQYVNSLLNTNWSEIITFEAAADNDVWYDPEPANQASKFYQVLSLP